MHTSITLHFRSLTRLTLGSKIVAKIQHYAIARYVNNSKGVRKSYRLSRNLSQLFKIIRKGFCRTLWIVNGYRRLT